MVGTNGPRLLRLTAELADHWNGNLRLPGQVAAVLGPVEEACLAVGRDPATLTKSIEALVRVLPPRADQPAEELELRGTPAELAASLHEYEELGIDELQIQMRPNSLEGVFAFARVIEAMAD
jgi:alkanesulfonate monooxygenase SsuD/methylene tetrahydromethanopterin reductase-like flavin-dependent oxidoreductase (luciferase family)